MKFTRAACTQHCLAWHAYNRCLSSPKNEDTGPEVREVSPAPRAPTWALIIVGLASLAMVTGLVLDRITISSKVLTSPGTTRNIAPMLQVQDSKTYDADGRIEMVTVKSNLQPSLLEMIGGWL